MLVMKSCERFSHFQAVALKINNQIQSIQRHLMRSRRRVKRFASLFKVHLPLEHNQPMEACLRAQCIFIMSEKAHS